MFTVSYIVLPCVRKLLAVFLDASRAAPPCLQNVLSAFQNTLQGYSDFVWSPPYNRMRVAYKPDGILYRKGKKEEYDDEVIAIFEGKVSDGAGMHYC